VSQPANIDTLRFSTAGSVDDGKSTLIGRLLYEAHGILADQLLTLEHATKRHGHVDEKDAIDFSLLTDGLIAEREQGITIDVAYRYFATPKRRFIIADTPGHEQYTRNMVTGASTADLTIVLLDVKRGVTTQSHRHAVIASMLGIPHLVVAVNKMDLVGYDESTFTALKNSFAHFLAKLNFTQITFIPISALRGDMLTTRGNNMPWYKGNTLLATLETTNAFTLRSKNLSLRFPVQRVSKAKFGVNHDLRGYQGQVAAGQLNVGDSLTILPAQHEAKVTAILAMQPLANEVTTIDEAHQGQAVTLVLDRQLDISRGDVFVNSEHDKPSIVKPYIGRLFSANLCWFDPSMLDFQQRYWLKQNSKMARAVIERIDFRFNVETLAHENTDKVTMNDIVRVSITTSLPLVFDLYENCRETGAFILIDDTTNRTVAGGMIVAALPISE
jgi:sulfate adenylyltransferase subunit 1